MIRHVQACVQGSSMKTCGSKGSFFYRVFVHKFQLDPSKSVHVRMDVKMDAPVLITSARLSQMFWF